jgi:hypothetical protein
MTTTYINIGGQTREATGNEPDRRFRDAWVLSGDAITLDPVKQRELFVAEVKAEAGRRIITAHPMHKQMNAAMRAIELERKGDANWTAEEAAEAAALVATANRIKAIRARSNVLEQGEILSLSDLKADATWATS